MCCTDTFETTVTGRDTAGSLDVGWFRKRVVERHEMEYEHPPPGASNGAQFFQARVTAMKVMKARGSGHAYALLYVTRDGYAGASLAVLKCERIVCAPAGEDGDGDAAECHKYEERDDDDADAERDPWETEGRCVPPPPPKTLAAPVVHEHVVLYSHKRSSSYVQGWDHVLYALRYPHPEGAPTLRDVVAVLSVLNEPDGAAAFDDAAYSHRRSFWYAAMLVHVLAGFSSAPDFRAAPAAMRPALGAAFVSLDRVGGGGWEKAGAGLDAGGTVWVSFRRLDELFRLVTGETFEEACAPVERAARAERAALQCELERKSAGYYVKELESLERRERELHKKYLTLMRVGTVGLEALLDEYARGAALHEAYMGRLGAEVARLEALTANAKEAVMEAAAE